MLGEMTAEEFRKLRRRMLRISKFNVLAYKLTQGRLMGTVRGGHPVVLITMCGAKSGRERTVPLIYVPFHSGILLVAAQGGAPHSPMWVHNLMRYPEILMQQGARRIKLRARLASAVEKAELWPLCVEHYPLFGVYQLRTTRDFPVFICEP